MGEAIPKLDEVDKLKEEITRLSNKNEEMESSLTDARQEIQRLTLGGLSSNAVSGAVVSEGEDMVMIRYWEKKQKKNKKKLL